MTGLARAARRVPRGGRGRPGADRRDTGPDRPARLGDRAACPVRPAGQGPHPAAWGRAVHALVILAEIGDITRFPTARKLASWAGLTPTVRGSDRVAHYGHISTQGSVWLRWVLGEAAQTAKRSPQFAAGYQAIAARRGKKIATTAVARKLLTRTWHLLTDAERAAPQPATARPPGKQRR
jgi:hypothetical protein